MTYLSICRSADIIKEKVLSFYHIDSKDYIKVQTELVVGNFTVLASSLSQNYNIQKKKSCVKSWRDGSVITNTYCSYGGLEFDSFWCHNSISSRCKTHICLLYAHTYGCIYMERHISHNKNIFLKKLISRYSSYIILFYLSSLHKDIKYISSFMYILLLLYLCYYISHRLCIFMC